MSTTTTEPIAPPPVAASAPSHGDSPVETAPSAVMAELPAFPRAVGMLGLVVLVLGVAVIIATKATSTPRLIPEGYAYLFVAFGIALTLYHAMRDGEQEIRRMYGAAGALFILIGVVVSLVPGPVFDSGIAVVKSSGYNLLPWGVGAAFVGLLYLLPFARHETDEVYRRVAVDGMLVIGALLTVGSLIAGVVEPDLLAGPAIALALLGLAYVCGYFGQTDTSEGPGYRAALALGVVGSLALLYALVRSAAPPMLYEGPNALRNVKGRLDIWLVGSRLLAACAFAGLMWFGAKGRLANPTRAVFVLVGLTGLIVLALASFATTLTVPPKPFLIPGGIVLGGLGFACVAVSLGICSDSQFVTLVRRELSAYFLSPIGYLVLGGMALVQWVGYALFVDALSKGGTTAEPIVRDYFFNLIPVLCVVLPIPALTMRLLAEERRTGTLEVLLTGPVNEAPVVLSKFLATWIFFLLCWLPTGLFLVALRMEGEAFDYRPLLSFYVALAACSATFVAVGILFSALTRDQIIAAVLTFAVLMGFVACVMVRNQSTILGPTGQLIVNRLSFLNMWLEALNGQLLIRDVAIWLSAAVFFLFVSVKCLEIRKWN